MMNARIDKPQIVAVQYGELEPWVSWEKWRESNACRPGLGKQAHAFLFEDGSVLDANSGWRPGHMRYCPHCFQRQP